MLLMEFVLFLSAALLLTYSYRSTGLARTVLTYLPIGLTGTIVDNIVVATGYLRYDGAYLLWLGRVPLSVSFTWGSILCTVRILRQILRKRFGKSMPWSALLPTWIAIVDAIVERVTPNSWLGWTWIVNNSLLGSPPRNLVGWFLILGSSLFMQDFVLRRFEGEATRLAVMCLLSVMQTFLVTMTLIFLGCFIE